MANPRNEECVECSDDTEDFCDHCDEPVCSYCLDEHHEWEHGDQEGHL
jgi:hypothetical protein